MKTPRTFMSLSSGSKLAILLACIMPFNLFAESIPVFAPGYRPGLDTDEGGFWYMVDKFEKDVQKSPYVVRDEALNAYISDMVCELAGEHCPDIRVYVVDNPHFNATMYPNGMMQVWSGLLLRVENEAELAAVLGHEIAHYLRAHQIQRWRKLKNNAAVAMFFDVFLTGGLAQLAVLGSAMAFSRSNELEADTYGVELMSRVGYAPEAAADLWRYVESEEQVDKSKQKKSMFFSTHPKPKKRIEKLTRSAESLREDINANYAHYPKRFLVQMKPHYDRFMSNHLALQEYEQTEHLLQQHERLGYSKASIAYYRGEMHRMRKQEGDLDSAIAAYEDCLTAEKPRAEAYKALGYIYLKAKQYASANKNFTQYLAVEPTTTDREMIEFYLQTTEGKANEIQ